MPEYKCCNHCEGDVLPHRCDPDKHPDACEWGCNGSMCKYDCGHTEENCQGECQEDA